MKHLKLFEAFTNNIVIGIDIDGTINNMVDAYNDMYSKYFPNNKVFNADMWDWYKQMNYDGIDATQWFNSHKAEVFDTCQPYLGAVDTIGTIYDFVKSLGYTLNIVTNQPTTEAKVAAKKWLDKNGFRYDDVNFANPSSAKWEYADIMVDDGLKVLKSKPLDKVTIKIMQLWNADILSDFEIPSINSLTPEILQQAIDKYETLKIFEKFFNNDRLSDFEFAIDIRNSSKEDINSVIKEFEKYTDYVKINDFIAEIFDDLKVRNNPKKYPHVANALPWAWIIRINNLGYKEIHYSEVSTPNWGAGVRYMEDIITLKEFLSVGLAGVKEYIEMKNAINKYNL